MLTGRDLKTETNFFFWHLHLFSVVFCVNDYCLFLQLVLAMDYMFLFLFVCFLCDWLFCLQCTSLDFDHNVMMGGHYIDCILDGRQAVTPPSRCSTAAPERFISRQPEGRIGHDEGD